MEKLIINDTTYECVELHYGAQLVFGIKTTDYNSVKHVLSHVTKIGYVNQNTNQVLYSLLNEFVGGDYTIQIKQNYYMEDNMICDGLLITMNKPDLSEKVRTLEEEVYGIVDTSVMSLSELRQYTKQTVNEQCQQVIASGIDVQVDEENTEHFSLTAEDQRNILNLASLLQQNVSIESLPYHADGAACKEYKRAILLSLYITMNVYITQCTTRCNYLKLYIETIEDRDTLLAMNFMTELPAEYQSKVDAIMDSVHATVNSVVASL